MDAGPATVATKSDSSSGRELEPATDSAGPVCFLTAMPIELLTEIMKDFSGLDVVRFKNLCRKLQDASKDHVLWARLVSSYFAADPQPKSHYLERPVSGYTAYELENLWMRWTRLEVPWTSRNVLLPRERVIQVPEFGGKSFLLPGGRWLLIAARDGRIMYHDLNADDPASSGDTLIPAQIADDPEALICMSEPDIDKSAPSLTINIAVGLFSPSVPAFTKIWRVTLVINEDNRAIGLAARQLKSIQLHASIRYIRHLSLLGAHVALTVVTFNEDQLPNHIIILDWTRVRVNTHLTHCLSRTMWTPTAEYGWLLPNNRILFVCWGGMHQTFVEWNDFDETRYEPVISHAWFIGALWSTGPDIEGPGEERVHHDLHQISPPYICKDSIRFIFRERGAIYGLTIPTDPPYNYYLGPYVNAGDGRIKYFVKLADISAYASDTDGESGDPLPGVILGYRHIVTVNARSEVVLVSYSWPDVVGGIPDISKNSAVIVGEASGCSRSTPSALPVCMDEGSGRIVKLDVGARKYSVLDL